MRGRTVILVSHHVQLCAPGASYIVALDNGRVQFQGTVIRFKTSGVMNGLVQSGEQTTEMIRKKHLLLTIEDVMPITPQPDSHPIPMVIQN